MENFLKERKIKSFLSDASKKRLRICLLIRSAIAFECRLQLKFLWLKINKELGKTDLQSAFPKKLKIYDRHTRIFNTHNSIYSRTFDWLHCRSKE